MLPTLKKDKLHIKPPVQMEVNKLVYVSACKHVLFLFFCLTFAHFNTWVCRDRLVFGENLKFPLEAWRLPLGFHTWKLMFSVSELWWNRCTTEQYALCNINIVFLYNVLLLLSWHPLISLSKLYKNSLTEMEDIFEFRLKSRFCTFTVRFP